MGCRGSELEEVSRVSGANNERTMKDFGRGKDAKQAGIFAKRKKSFISAINRLNDRLILSLSNHDLFGHCGQNRRFSRLRNFYYSRIIGTREPTNYNCEEDTNSVLENACPTQLLDPYKNVEKL